MSVACRTSRPAPMSLRGVLRQPIVLGAYILKCRSPLRGAAKDSAFDVVDSGTLRERLRVRGEVPRCRELEADSRVRLTPNG